MQQAVLAGQVDTGQRGHKAGAQHPVHHTACLLYTSCLLEDTLRPDARETLAFFGKQGVEVKVISGDSAASVAEIARRAGVPGAERYVDGTALQGEAALRAAAEQYTVFGRMTPGQKRILVHALQSKGHTVAMTGDGVNDVLALKEADCSVAMAAGSDAARNVAEIVLVDNDFAAMPLSLIHI